LLMVASLVRDVILRDGTTLRLRSPEPADEQGLRAFFGLPLTKLSGGAK
jgi:hypothetical protein